MVTCHMGMRNVIWVNIKFCRCEATAVKIIDERLKNSNFPHNGDIRLDITFI